jgi:hypothetical protein
MFGVDTLIILGIVAAASIAASQISASENESASNKLTDQKQQFAMRQQAINFYKNQQDQAAARTQARYGAGGVSASAALQPWADKLAIQNGADLERQAAARQADATRTQGYLSAGSTLAQGIAGQALRPSSGSTYSFGAGYDGSGLDTGARIGSYDLNPQSSQLLGSGAPVQTPQLHALDPNGGFQLQPDDYALLSGQNPNRYRFTL